MSKSKFKVGDRVQFKSWEEMEREYGLDGGGVIKLHPRFTQAMKHLCGTYATIKGTYDRTGVLLKDFTTDGSTGWSYCTEMLKPAKQEFEIGDRVRLLKEARSKLPAGSVGTIVDTDFDILSVEWDNFTSGHDCGGRCKKSKSGWNIHKEIAELIHEDRELKVGDRVQFKTWEELASEFMIDSDGDIDLGGVRWFRERMKPLCGTFATIKTIYSKDTGKVGLTDFTSDYTYRDGENYWLETLKLAVIEEPEEPVETFILNDQEIRILARTDKKWIARDKDGLIFIYLAKPVRDIGGEQWYSNEPYSQVLKKELFKMITWENSPVEINKLKGEK